MTLPPYSGDESHHDKGAPLLIFPGNFPAEQQAEGLANTTPPPDNTRIAVQPVYARGGDRSSIVVLVGSAQRHILKVHRVARRKLSRYIQGAVLVEVLSKRVDRRAAPAERTPLPA